MRVSRSIQGDKHPLISAAMAPPWWRRAKQKKGRDQPPPAPGKGAHSPTHEPPPAAGRGISSSTNEFGVPWLPGGIRSDPVPAGASVVMLPRQSLLLCTHWEETYEQGITLQFTSASGLIIECIHRPGLSGSYTPCYNAVVTFLGLFERDRRCWVALQGYGTAWGQDGGVVDYSTTSWQGELHQFWPPANVVQAR